MNNLIEVLQQLGRPRILVVGDVMLDRYVWGNAERVSQEAPVVVLREEKRENRPGGAASVAALLCGLGADVSIAGVVGSDDDGWVLREELGSVGVNCDCLHAVEDRPTTVKERFVGLSEHRNPHQMLRVDRESCAPICDGLDDHLIPREFSDSFDAILVSDYRKGVCTPLLLKRIMEKAQHSVPVIIDPANLADYSKYTGATAITPNRAEALGVSVKTPPLSISGALLIAGDLRNCLALKHCFVTLDSDGIVLSTKSATLEQGHFPTRKRAVCDVTNAGDVVLAVIGLCAARDVNPADSARLANVAGGLAVEQFGAAHISRDDMKADILANDKHAA